MLVLSRKAGQCIVIDSTIRIMVVSIGNGRVRLAFDAPGHAVDREEIHERKILEAAASQPEKVHAEA